LKGHTSDDVTSVAFSPDGQILASGSDDRTITLWNIATGTTIGEPLEGHTSAVSSITFSPDGTTLASGSWDGTITLWDLKNKQPIITSMDKHIGTDNRSSMAFSPDAQTFASKSCSEYDKEKSWICIAEEITLWDVATGQPIGEPLVGHTSSVNSVVFSPDGQILASGGCAQRDSDGFINCIAGEIILWDVATGSPIGEPLAGHTNDVNSVVFSPDGQTLASASSDQTIRLWDVATGQPSGDPLQGHTSVVRSVAFSPDGQTLASVSGNGTIILWDVATGQPIGDPLQGHTSGVRSVAFSPDGQTLASGNINRTIILWDVAMGVPIGAPLDEHMSGVNTLMFSPDGQTLASGSCTERNSFCSGGEIILWDVATGSPIGNPMEVQTSGISAVAFSKDGTTLASASGNDSIILWDVALDSWKARACRAAGRNLTWEEWQRYMDDRPYKQTCSDLPVHPSFIESGRDLAREGNIEGAIARFEEALALDPDLDIDPQAIVAELGAPALVEQGETLAREGDIEGAIARFEEALALDPSSPVR
jgi:WD40 repeat protein